MIDKALLPYLHGFWQVAKHRSFTRAGDHLNISQSAVSYQIKLLEERLEKRLFDREKRAELRLTPAGQLLASHCDEWFAKLEQCLDNIGGGSLQGELTLAGPTCFGSVILCDVLKRMGERYPDLRTHLRLGDEHIDLRSEHVDFAVRTISHSPDHYTIPLLKTGSRIVVSRAYAEHRGVPLTIDELHQHTMILTNPGDPDWQSLREQVPAIPGRLDKEIYIDNALAMLQAVRQGMGMCYLPQYLVDDGLRSGDLVEILPETLAQAHIILYLCSPFQSSDNPKISATLAVLKESILSAPNSEIYEWLAAN